MIDGYEFGEITVDGKIYHHDVIIYKDKVDDSWRRIEGHRISLGDVAQILDKKPEILVIGTGADGVMAVPEKVKAEIEAKGIAVIINRTGDACEKYNELAPSKNVIAALHLTC
ncbi:MAG: Mth938-like domain-containing protein [bacterium]